MKYWITAILATAITGLALADDVRTEMERLGVNPDQSYSGTRHIETKDVNLDMFVRRAPQKMRMDMSMQGQSISVITREDLGVNYSLLPELNMYRVVKSDDIMGSTDGLTFSDVSEVGNEEVSGYRCVKYKAQFTDAKGGRAGGYYWVSDDGIMMKVDMIYQSSGQKGERMIMTLSDVEIGDQDPAYFELPENYSSSAFNLGMGQTPDDDQPSLVEEVEAAAKDEAEQTVIDETRDQVRKGLGSLFKN